MEQITLPGIMGSHAAAIEFLSRQAQRAELDPKAEGKLHLAFDEILTNIITHGYAEQGVAGDITLQAELTPEALTLTLEDAAPPFDPRNRAKPAILESPLESRPIGGVGIYLTMQSVDRFDYNYRDGKNRNILVMNRART